MAIAPIGNYPLIPFGGNPIQNLGSLIVTTTVLYILSNIPRASAADSVVCALVCLPASGVAKPVCEKSCDELVEKSGVFDKAVSAVGKGIFYIAPTIAATMATSSAWNFYGNYMARDDADLIDLINKPLCGRVYEMPHEMQACFRKYLFAAAGRLSEYIERKELRERISLCFSYDPRLRSHECGWWPSNPLKWIPAEYE